MYKYYVHALLNSINGKDNVLRIWVYSSFEKMEPTRPMFFLKKPSLVVKCTTKKEG